MGVSPSQRHVRYLWQTLRRFSPENRALFLRFVWGRTRLPATPSEWGDVRFTVHTRHTSSPDTAYPVAHTCFFSLELPTYSSLAICTRRVCPARLLSARSRPAIVLLGTGGCACVSRAMLAAPACKRWS